MFQSTPPCGGRRTKSTRRRRGKSVSIHAPRAGGDLGREKPNEQAKVSIHAPVRGATPELPTVVWVKLFQSTPPCGGRPPEVRGVYYLMVLFQSTPPCGGRPV